MKQDKNWPQLSTARIDEMVNAATAFPQERGQVFIWWSRPAMAVAATVVLLIAVAATWSLPRTPYNSQPVQNISAAGDELSDYLTYQMLEDLT